VKKRSIDLENNVYALNDVMEIDHVIRVWPDGTVSEPRDVHAPELFDGEVGGAWTLMNGYSGQYGYSGPLMHASEFIGGYMALDILKVAGWYVALVNTEPDDSDPTSWAVAYVLAECEDHEPEWWQPMGATVECDGTCVNPNRSY
jgi:hypothetical protein